MFRPSIATAIAWRSGDRRAIRIDAAALIINGLATVPGFFVPANAGIRLVSTVIVLLTVLAVVLMLRPARRPATITD
jgi:hypothetical protein